MPDVAAFRLARRRTLPATLLVGAHLGVAAWHYTAHERLGVALPAWETAFVALVAMTAPVLALVLLWGARWQGGALLLGVAMAAGLALDLARHFVVEGPHHLAGAPEGAWSRAYRLTALLLVLTGSLGLAAAGWLLRQAPDDARPSRAARRRR